MRKFKSIIAITMVFMMTVVFIPTSAFGVTAPPAEDQTTQATEDVSEEDAKADEGVVNEDVVDSVQAEGISSEPLDEPQKEFIEKQNPNYIYGEDDKSIIGVYATDGKISKADLYVALIAFTEWSDDTEIFYSTYVVYGNKCGKSFKKLKTTTSRSFKVKKIGKKKLKAHKQYKFYVVAYTAKGKVTSPSVHFITGNRQGKYANVKTIKAKAGSLTLYVGESKKVGATYKMYYGKKHVKKSHGAALRFISDCPGVATVDANGNVTAEKSGTATIYIQDIGGKYCRTVVTVK